MAPGSSRHESLYRALVVLYPQAFRRDYGDPMVQLFADRVRDVGGRAWLRAVPDLVRTVPIERIEAVMNRLGRGGRVLALAFVVLGATAVSIGVGAGAAPILAVAVVGILVSQRRMFSTLGGERAPLRHAVVQAWWAPVAGALGLLMVLAGVGTFFEAHNLGGRIFGTALLIAFGGAMLFGLMRRPFARSTGNSLILLATIPAMALWWVILPPLAALTIWVGVLASGFEEPAVV